MGSGPQKTVRKRVIPSPKRGSTLDVIWESTHVLDSPKYSNTRTHGSIAASTYQGTQVTESENHPAWRRGIPGTVADIGGDFFTQKTEVLVSPSDQVITRQRVIDQWRKQTSIYRGPILAVDQNQLSAASNPTFGIPAASYSSDELLHALGAQAIAACKPTNSVADLAVFLGELYREGLPRLAGAAMNEIKRPSQLPRKGSEEYLNLEFGLKPVLSDFRDFAKVITHANDVVRQYMRDSGRVVRRRWHFPTTETVTGPTLVGSNQRARTGTLNSDLLAPGTATGDIYRTDRTVRSRWFSGAFTYHLPNPDGSGKLSHYAQVVDKLVGINLDPELLWNLAPWSWAVDWFTNVGDVLSNVSDMADDGLVLRWGYIMEHTVQERTFSLVGPSGLWGNPPASEVKVVIETKIRRKASPFGFGLTWESFTGRQLAILSALGITRGSKGVQYQ